MDKLWFIGKHNTTNLQDWDQRISKYPEEELRNLKNALKTLEQYTRETVGEEVFHERKLNSRVVREKIAFALQAGLNLDKVNNADSLADETGKILAALQDLVKLIPGKIVQVQKYGTITKLMKFTKEVAAASEVLLRKVKGNYHHNILVQQISAFRSIRETLRKFK